MKDGWLWRIDCTTAARPVARWSTAPEFSPGTLQGNAGGAFPVGQRLSDGCGLLLVGAVLRHMTATSGRGSVKCWDRRPGPAGSLVFVLGSGACWGRDGGRVRRWKHWGRSKSGGGLHSVPGARAVGAGAFPFSPGEGSREAFSAAASRFVTRARTRPEASAQKGRGHPSWPARRIGRSRELVFSVARKGDPVAAGRVRPPAGPAAGTSPEPGARKRAAFDEKNVGPA